MYVFVRGCNMLLWTMVVSCQLQLQKDFTTSGLEQLLFTIFSTKMCIMTASIEVGQRGDQIKYTCSSNDLSIRLKIAGQWPASLPFKSQCAPNDVGPRERVTESAKNVSCLKSLPSSKDWDRVNQGLGPHFDFSEKRDYWKGFLFSQLPSGPG